MTALDQAFIKAYKQQGPSGQPLPREAAPPASPIDGGSDSIETRIAATSAKLNDVIAALEKPSGKLVDTPSAEAAAVGDERQAGKNEAEVLSFVSPPAKRAAKVKTTQRRKKKASPAPTLDELDMPDVIYRLDPPCPTIPEAPRGALFTNPPPGQRLSPENSSSAPSYDINGSACAGPLTQGEIADSPSADAQKTRRFDPPADAMQSQAVESPSKVFYPESSIRVFQPMLQVDHFAWPKVCHRLESAAAMELDRLAETLLAAAKKDMKVVGLSGAERGDGATTLLLCAARRLAARGVKTVIVDADLGEPQLAKRLGLLPQLGWEDVASGRQPVEEVLVESAADNIAILPLCRPLAITGISYASQRLMAESLNTLRKNYDLVLMDLGPLENPQSLGDLTGGGLNCRIDAVMVVHKAGKVLATCMPAARQSLASAGVAVAGVIENFVRDPLISES